jgi:hypothetical protein
MLKRFLSVAAFAAILVPATSHAVDHTGQWALGYYDADAPIGIRYQFSPKAAFDAGIGFANADVANDESVTQFHVELGVPLTLVKTDRADFFFRPGLLYKSIPYFVDNGVDPVSKERASDMSITGHFGAEWHATDNLSFSVGHGIRFNSSKGVGTGETFASEQTESSSSFTALDALDITRIGFRWYF